MVHSEHTTRHVVNRIRHICFYMKVVVVENSLDPLISFSIFWKIFGKNQFHYASPLDSAPLFDTKKLMITTKKSTTVAAAGDDDASAAAAAQTQLTPYRFSVTEEKGKKAMVRFRENLRKYYSACNLGDALWMRDNPILEIYCYDPDTGIGYCRLSSNKHDGPIFESPKQLYETYNCSSQGHPNDVFIYCCEGDEDHGMEMSKFLKEIEILKPDQFPEEYQQLFQESVRNNVLLAAYSAALEEKRSAKKSSAETTSDTAAQPAKKKRAATSRSKRPPKEAPPPAAATAVEENPSATKKPKVAPPAESSSSTPEPTLTTVLQLLPPSVESLQLDEDNLNDSTAVFSYQTQEVRLGDLPDGSIERASMCWNFFSHLIASRKTPLTIAPGATQDEILKAATK